MLCFVQTPQVTDPPAQGVSGVHVCECLTDTLVLTHMFQ